MRSSANYNLRLVEGTDIVNPLVQDVPNYEKIDEVMKDNEMASIGTAVELVSQTVHAITRTWKTTDFFRFTATANFTAGETFTVDGLQVTALLPNGEPLGTGAYITGSEVLASLNSDSMVMTVYTSGGTATLAQDSEKLGGQLPAYYATKTEVEQAQATATASGILAQSAQSAVTALETKVGTYKTAETAIGTWIDGKTLYRKIFSAKNVSLTSDTIVGNIPANSSIVNIHSTLKHGNYVNSDLSEYTNTRTNMYSYSSNNDIHISIINTTITAYIVFVEYTK